MSKEMEGHMGSQEIEGTIKEVRQVYRSPARREKGEKSNVEDACPEEISNVELHVTMEKLFRKSPAPIIQGNPIPQSLSSSSPDLPLVLYNPPDNFFLSYGSLAS